MKEIGPLLEVKNISKTFGKNNALSDVSFNLGAGKILGLIGDNNAGKSTLLKILCGGLQPSGGNFYINGEEIHFRHPADAMKQGIAMVYESLELVNIAPIWENFYMGRELTKRKGHLAYLDVRRMKKISAETIEGYGHKFNVEHEVGKISGGQRQIIAVTRAMHANPQLLLLDEPTHGLSDRVINDIFNILKKAKEDKNISIIVTGQWYEQIKDFVDEVIVLRMGKIVGRFDSETANAGNIFKLATGLTT